MTEPASPGRLDRLLSLRPGERSMVLLVAALFMATQSTHGLSANAADALFFRRFGVENLPFAFMLLGLATAVVTLLYSAGFGRWDKKSYLTALLAAIAALILVERAAIPSGDFIYPVIWVTLNVAIIVTLTMMWNVAGEVCDTRQAKRLFPLFASAGILGGVVGNVATGPLARTLGTENLLIVVAAVLVAVALFARLAVDRYFPATTRRKSKPRIWDDVREGFDIVRETKLFRLLSYGVLLMAALFYAVVFPFSQAVAAEFPDESDVAAFLGTFAAVATSIAFLTSLLVANRLYARIGVIASLLSVPLVYVAGFSVWLTDFRLVTAAAVRLVQWVITMGIGFTATSAVFNVARPAKRGRATAFVNAVPYQTGVVLAGLLLLLGDRVLERETVFAVGAGLGVVTALIVWVMRKEYGRALVAALRRGALDVFLEAAPGVTQGGRGHEPVAILTQRLDDPDPMTRRLAVQVLARSGSELAVSPLRSATADPEAEVRADALECLWQLDPASASDEAGRHISDQDARVRAVAAKCLSADGGARTSLQPLLADEAPQVRGAAAGSLGSAAAEARRVVKELLGSPDRESRLAGLAAYERDPGFDHGPVIELLRGDGSVEVRVAAARALGESAATAASDALIEALGDDARSVRQTAARALRGRSGVGDRLLTMLGGRTWEEQLAVLAALTGRSDIDSQAVVRWLSERVDRLRSLRLHGSRLRGADGTPATVALAATIRDRDRGLQEGVLTALGVLAEGESLHLIGRGLRSDDIELRSQALEALESVTNEPVVRLLVPLLEETATVSHGSSYEAMQELTSDADPWLRALAVKAIAETHARDWSRVAAQGADDPSRLVRLATEEGAAIMGSGMGTSLDTMGTLDRVVFLKRVPIFSDLPPEDLERIAEVATEQSYEAGEAVYREGEPGNDMIVIVDGQVSVSRTVGGETIHIRDYGPGEHVGELAVLRRRPRAADVDALSDTRALVISAPALTTVLHDRPDVAIAMLGSLAERLGTLV